MVFSSTVPAAQRHPRLILIFFIVLAIDLFVAFGLIFRRYMNYDMPTEVIYFMHVYKSGGTSFANLLADSSDPARTCVGWNRTPWRRPSGRSQLAGRPRLRSLVTWRDSTAVLEPDGLWAWSSELKGQGELDKERCAVACPSAAKAPERLYADTRTAL